MLKFINIKENTWINLEAIARLEIIQRNVFRPFLRIKMNNGEEFSLDEKKIILEILSKIDKNRADELEKEL